MTEIREILRRLQLGERARRIARDLGVSRNTVAHYRRLGRHARAADGAVARAGEAGRVARAPAGAAPGPGAVPGRAIPRAGPGLARQGGRGPGDLAAPRRAARLRGSYSSVKRFSRRVAPPTPRATLRLEVDPGDEAQVDFGFGGLYRDPESDRLRRAWVFVMTLSCSRHQYAELPSTRASPPGCACIGRRSSSSGRAPPVVLDNLRAAIVHAALYDPEVQRSYREFAEHYGFLIAPCRPRTPEHKGKVEQGGPLRQAQRPGGPRLPGPARRQSPSAPLVCRDRRPPRPRHDQADPPGGLRPGRARGPAAGAPHALGSPSGSRPSSTRLPCRLRRGLLLGAPPPHRPAALGPRHRVEGRALSGVRPRGDASARPPRPAADPDGPPPARQGPLPPADPRPGVAPARPRSARLATSSSGCSAIAPWIGSAAPRACCAWASGTAPPAWTPPVPARSRSASIATTPSRPSWSTLRGPAPAQPHARRGRHPGDPGPPCPPLDHLFPDPGAEEERSRWN